MTICAGIRLLLCIQYLLVCKELKQCRGYLPSMLITTPHPPEMQEYHQQVVASEPLLHVRRNIMLVAALTTAVKYVSNNNPGHFTAGASIFRRCLRWPSLRPDAMYPTYWYTWALISNLVLRLTWTHRLLGDLEAHATVTMAVALLEVYRRHQWAYIRVETELRRIRAKESRGLGSPEDRSGGGGAGVL